MSDDVPTDQTGRAPPAHRPTRCRRVRHLPGRRLRRPVRPAHRPAGARGARLLRDRAPLDHRRRGAGAGAGGADPVGRPQVGPRRRRARCSTPRSTSWASPSSASATAPSSSPSSSAARWPGAARASTAARALTVTGRRGRRPARRPAGRPDRVDEPLRRHRPGARRVRGHRHVRPAPRWPRSSRRAGGSGASSTTPRCRTRRTASRCIAPVPAPPGRRPGPPWTMTSIIEQQVAAVRAQVGRRPGHLRPVGRRRLGGGGRAGPQGDRARSSPACSSTPACCARARASRWSRRSSATSASS